MSFLLPLTLLAAVAVLYFSYRYAWWRPAVDYRNPRILMYHMISPPRAGAKFNSLRVTPEMFEKQLEYLNKHGWRFHTMSELVRLPLPLPPKCVALTFDDGYEDNYKQMLPLLEKYDARATVYLVVDRHNREWSSKRKKKNRSGELMREPKLLDSQVLKLIESGRVEIGSHTVTHDNLTALESDQKQHEIVESRNLLEKRFAKPCLAFCYPFGLYDESDVALVRSAGYESATTVEKGIDNWLTADPLRLKRITISSKDNLIAFRLKLRSGKRGIKK